MGIWTDGVRATAGADVGFVEGAGALDTSWGGIVTVAEGAGSGTGAIA